MGVTHGTPLPPARCRQYGDAMSSAARDRFVDEMATALNQAGLPRLPSRVFSALLADDDGRMTSAELLRRWGSVRQACPGRSPTSHAST